MELHLRELFTEIHTFISKWELRDTLPEILNYLAEDNFNKEWINRENEIFAFYVDSENLKETYKLIFA